MKRFIVHRKGEALLNQDGLTLQNLPEEFLKTFPDLSPKYIDSLSLLAGIAAQRALGNSSAQGDGKDFGVIVGSAFGAIDSTVDFDSQALSKGPNAVNPMDFPNTVANAAGSRIGIWLQLKGPNVTLTNGETSLIDAMGFAFEGHDSGLFERCLVGAVEKVPPALKSLTVSEAQWREGACLFLASGDPAGEFLFEVEDYFALQLKPDLSLPGGFLQRFETLLKGVEWLGCPAGTPLEPRFPRNLSRYIPDVSTLEMGLSGFESMNHFLSAPQLRGVMGVFSRTERKFSFVKMNKKRSR